jgi:hypothetical protein
MKLQKFSVPWVVLAMVILVFSCSEDPARQAPAGFISVQVIDSPGDLPVPDVEVTIPGTGQTALTDKNGTAVFAVAAGVYYVDAHVCCIGPGWIDHHVQVEVQTGKTVEVRLHACSACV